MRVFARKQKQDASSRTSTQPPLTALPEVGLLHFAAMSRALRADAVSTHRDLFTAGTPKAEQRRLTGRLSRILAAQAALAAGTYGTCSSCSTPIERERLAAVPTCTQCAGCTDRVVVLPI